MAVGAEHLSASRRAGGDAGRDRLLHAAGPRGDRTDRKAGEPRPTPRTRPIVIGVALNRWNWRLLPYRERGWRHAEGEISVKSMTCCHSAGGEGRRGADWSRCCPRAAEDRRGSSASPASWVRVGLKAILEVAPLFYASGMRGLAGRRGGGDSAGQVRRRGCGGRTVVLAPAAVIRRRSL